MSGKESPTPMFVTKKQAEFTITFRLPPVDECLDIRVDDANTLQVYEQWADDKFIAANGLQGFANYVDLYRYLAEHLSSVVFEDDTIKCGGARPIKIKVGLQGRDWVERAHFRIDGLTERLQKEEAKVGQLEKELQDTKNQLAEANRRIDALWEAVFVKPPPPPPPVANPFYHHPGNSQAQYFTLTTTSPTSAKLMCPVLNDTWYANFVNGAEILPQKIAKYTIKITKLHVYNIMLGFCTSSGLGVRDNYKNYESAYYHCKGYLYNGGAMSSNYLVAALGDKFECEADLSTGVLRWYKNGNLFISINAPQMKGKTAYLSILLIANEEVQMSL